MKHLFKNEGLPVVLDFFNRLYHVLVSADKHIFYSNELFRKRIPVCTDTVLTELVHPNDIHLVDAALQQASNDAAQPVFMVLRLMQPDANYLFVSFKLQHLSDNSKGRYFQLLGMDVNAQQSYITEHPLMQQIDIYLNNSQLGIVFVDGAGVINCANQYFAELVQLPCNDLSNRILSDVLPHALDAIRNMLLQPGFLQNNSVASIEAGNLCRYELMVQPNTMGALLILYEITGFAATSKEEKHRPTDAPKGEEWFRQLLANAVDLVLVTDAAMHIQYVTSSVEKILGYTPEEVLGHNAADYIHADDLVPAATAFQDEAAGISFTKSVDLRLRCKNGSWKWVEGMGNNKLNDGIVNGMIIYLNDIEERKKAAAELAQSEKKYKAVVDTSYNGIIISDQQGHIVSVNPTLCNMFGYTQEAFTAKKLQDFMDFSGTNIVDTLQHLQSADSYRGEAEAMHKTGHRFWVELQTSFLYREGEVDYYSTVVRDIDKERAAQLELAKREALLGSIAKATTLLVTDPDWVHSVAQSMELVGRCLEVERVYIFETHTDTATGLLVHSQRFEWNAGIVQSQLRNPQLQQMPHSLVQELFQPLFENNPFAAHSTDVKQVYLQQLMERQGIQSLLLIPVFLGGQYWGMVGFDACKHKREWKWYEIETLRLYAVTLGGVIEQRKSERLIAESQHRYKLLFDENPAPLLSVRISDLRIRNVNTAAINHYGYSRDTFLQLQLTDICIDCNTMADALQQQLRNATANHPIQARHRLQNGSHIDVEITMQQLQLDENETQILLLITDVTESLRIQQGRDLIDSILNQLMQPKLLEANLFEAIRLMRRYLQWDAAELWSPSYDNSIIRLSVFETDLSDPAVHTFEKKGRTGIYTIEQYGSRPAVQTNTITCVEDIATDDTLIRKEMALEAGFASYVAFSIQVKGQVLGLLYLFSRRRQQLNAWQHQLLAYFGNHLAAEMEKRKKEKELDIFFSLGTDGMIICSSDGRYKKANPAFCAIVGYTAEELTHMYFLDLVLEEDRTNSSWEFERLVKSGQAGVFENRIRTKSGQLKWLEWTSGYDQVENIIVSSARDISEKKMAETQLAAASVVLQQAIQENRKILDYSQDIIATFTRDGIISNINPACEHLLGYTSEYMIGEHLSLFIHPSHTEQLLQLLTTLRNQDTTIKNYKIDFQHQQGTVVHMELAIHWSGEEQLAFTVARDITLQKKAEMALQASEKRFRIFMDNNPASAWIIDEQGTLLYINKHSNPLHIVDETLVGQNLYNHIDPKYLEAFKENNLRVLHENRPVEAIEIVPLQDGSEIIQLVYKFPVELDGKQRLIGGIGIDITAQKKAEKQLQLSEQRFRSFMDNNPAGAWINDEHGTFVFVNREYNSITRTPRPIKEGARLSELYDVQLAQQASQTDRQVIESGESLELEGWMPRGDGSMGYFLIYKFPVPSIDNRKLVGGIILDVTDRKLVEDEVVRIKNAIDNASDAVLIFDRKLNCVYANVGFQQLFGLDAQQLNKPGRSGFVLESASSDRRIFSALVKKGTWQGDLAIKNSKGATIYTSLRANVIVNAQQKITSYVGVFTNITERVMANKQIGETAERLTNIMESISEGMLLVRSNWQLEYMNPAAETITGIAATEAMGKKLLTAIPQLTGSKLYALLRAAMRKKDRIHFEEYFAPLEMWLDVSCYYLNEGLTIYFRNVTDRRRAQMQLALEREAFASITAGNRNFSEIADLVLQGIEAIYPGSLCSLLQLQHDGVTMRHISAPSLPAAYCSSIDGIKMGPAAGACGTAIYSGKMVITENIATDPNWHLYKDLALPFGLCSCWSHPLINAQGKAIGSFAIYNKRVGRPAEQEVMLVQRVANFLTLIYENLQAEQGLQKSNERFELATRATNEAIWDWELIENTVQWSHGFYTLFGVLEGELSSSFEVWKSRLHPDDAERVIQSLYKAVRSRKANNWSAEYRYRRSNGTYADVLDKGFMVRDAHNKVVRMVGAMQDISERKQLQEQLLEQQISKQKQMAQVAVAAQEKERAEIGKELHDNVNQLLTTTKLYLELAKSNTEMRDDLINRSATNISEIIQEIRQLSRSLVPYSITDLGMVAAVNDLIETLQLVNVIDIRFEYAGELEANLSPSIKVTLFRIIQEQLNNIIKHAYANSVFIQLQNRGSYVNLVVKDDGAGFDMKTVKRGIGISNILSRANMFDGKAAIISKPGKGCKLSVQIPLT